VGEETVSEAREFARIVYGLAFAAYALEGTWAYAAPMRSALHKLVLAELRGGGNVQTDTEDRGRDGER
jgi:hypothetical protein